MLLRDKKIKKVSKLDTFFIFDGWRVGLVVIIGYADVSFHKEKEPHS